VEDGSGAISWNESICSYARAVTGLDDGRESRRLVAVRINQRGGYRLIWPANKLLDDGIQVVRKEQKGARRDFLSGFSYFLGYGHHAPCSCLK